jgi:hypothetical protein
MHRLEDFAPGAAPPLPHRFRSPLQLHRLGAIHTITIVRLDKIPIIIGNWPPVAPAKAFPTETASPSNPHRRQPPTRRPRVPSWGAFGRPALRARAHSHEGRHPKPFTFSVIQLRIPNGSSCPLAAIAAVRSGGKGPPLKRSRRWTRHSFGAWLKTASERLHRNLLSAEHYANIWTR